MSRAAAARVRDLCIPAHNLMPILAAKVGGCVSLGQAVPYFPTPDHIVEAVSRALRDRPEIGRYSLQPGTLELREAIAADILARKNFVACPETEVCVTVGATESVLMAVMTVVEAGDEVLIPAPGYAAYAEQVRLAGGVPVYVPLRPDWSLDTDALRAACTSRTRAVFVCSPGNPTGTVYAEADVRALCALALEKDLMLFCDETYDFMLFGDTTHFSPTSLPEMRQHCILISSFSKKYAMTGWRVGYVVADAQWLAQLQKVHDTVTICPPTISQVAALAALTGPQDCVEYMRSTLEKRRNLAVERMNALSPHFDFVAPRGGLFVFARYTFTDAPSMDIAVDLLENGRVITVPGASFGPAGERHLRMSFGSDEAELEIAFTRIATWLDGKKS